jgi:hypothetical protein
MRYLVKRRSSGMALGGADISEEIYFTNDEVRR